MASSGGNFGWAWKYPPVLAVLLLAASSFGWQLGWPTFLAGVFTGIAVLARTRSAPWPVLASISWGVLPLVAGLFVLVEAADRTGVLADLVGVLAQRAHAGAQQAAWGVGVFLALACNVMNNLPAGLIAGTAVQAAHVPPDVVGAALIGVDLGPNLSVTGSLATILWLSALRREGLHVGAWAFLRLGVLVMPPALLAALAGLLVPALIMEVLR